jgi:hypothetical protein
MFESAEESNGGTSLLQDLKSKPELWKKLC